jgi:hypothetical protein
VRQFSLFVACISSPTRLRLLVASKTRQFFEFPDGTCQRISVDNGIQRLLLPVDRGGRSVIGPWSNYKHINPLWSFIVGERFAGNVRWPPNLVGASITGHDGFWVNRRVRWLHDELHCASGRRSGGVLMPGYTMRLARIFAGCDFDGAKYSRFVPSPVI